jgi:hypothetical protein
MQLCRQVGQYWRTVSLGGAGELGPLPVGLAANEADALEEGAQAEDLAWEVDTGSGHTRQLWKWACCQASEQISSSTSGGRTRCSRRCRCAAACLGCSPTHGGSACSAHRPCPSAPARSNGGAAVRAALRPVCKAEQSRTSATPHAQAHPRTRPSTHTPIHAH